MEDNVRLDRHSLAPSNAALVRQLVNLMPDHGRQPATVAQARALLALPDAWRFLTEAARGCTAPAG